MKLKILFYLEPRSAETGPDAVCWHLSKTLSKSVNITYYPRSVKCKGWAFNVAKSFGRYILNEFDIIHFITYSTWMNGSYMLLNSANLRKTPTVLNIHGLMAVENAFEPILRAEHSIKMGTRGKVPRLAWIDYFNSCKQAKKIIANSDYMKQEIEHSLGIPPEKIVVIPNGVDFKKFAYCTSNIALDGDPAILSVGRVCMLKGFGTMVSAVKQLSHVLPNMKLHFLGQANKEFRDYAKSKGVDNFLVFHGNAPHATVPSYLKSADFAIFGSRIYEGFGMVLVEAMAAGLPSIASDIDTYRQIVNNGEDGLLFKRGDTEDLSSAILKLSDDRLLRRRISKNSQITASQYDWEKIGEKYVSLYNNLA